MNNYLLYTIVTQWNEPPRARHQLAKELKKDGRVYFVEKNKVGLPHIELTEIEENIIIITPFFPVDYRIRYRTPFVNEIYHHWLLKKIQKLDIKFDMVITVDYTAPAIHKYFNNVLFYCADDNVGFGNFNPWLINFYHSFTEKKVASKAVLCIVTSDYMQSKIARFNHNCYTIPLGAPEVKITQITVRDKREKRPTLGLVGYLDSNLDEQLLDKLLKNFKIIFIGPAGEQTKARMLKYPNAIMIGPKTGLELVEALLEVDVCIAPYDVSKINKGATPNKLWLYLSVGRPSVITEIPNIKSWKFDNGLVYICSNDKFEEYCVKAYQEDNSNLANKRVTLAGECSWFNRVAKIRQLFYQSL